MDLLLNGRAAWNVVTSLNDSEAANFGAAQHLSHDLRYDRADEFMAAGSRGRFFFARSDVAKFLGGE